MTPTTRQSSSLHYPFLTRLPLELRTRIYELVLIETNPIKLLQNTNGTALLAMPLHADLPKPLPDSFQDTQKARQFFPALILDLGPPLAPFALEAREVFFRKNIFQVNQTQLKYFLACMRQLGVDHWIHNIEFVLEKQQFPPEDYAWELPFLDLWTFPLRRLEVNAWLFWHVADNHALHDFRMQLMQLEQHNIRRLYEMRREAGARGDGVQMQCVTPYGT